MFRKMSQAGSYAEDLMGFQGIYADMDEFITPTGFVPDMENLSIGINGEANSLFNPLLKINLAGVTGGTLNPPVWASGTYVKFAIVRPPTPNGYLYQCILAGSCTTTPESDTTHWQVICKTTAIIKGIYLWDEASMISPPLMIWTVDVLIGQMAVIDTTTWHGMKLGNFYYPVSFTAASTPSAYRLYFMDTYDGLWYYDSTNFVNVSAPTVGIPPKTKHIMLWNNRLWAYGEYTDIPPKAPKIYWSAIPSLPEEAVAGKTIDGVTYPVNTGFEFWDAEYTDHTEVGDLDNNDVVIQDSHSCGLTADNTDQANWYSIVTTGHGGELTIATEGNDAIKGCHAYKQSLAILSRDQITLLSGTSDTTFQTQLVYQGHDGAIANDMVEADALYYIGRTGIMAMSDVNPVNVSEFINTNIRTKLAEIDADIYNSAIVSACYFKDRIYFLIEDKIYVYYLSKHAWEQYDYDNMATLHSANHLYLGTTDGKVYILDSQGTGFTTWYMKSKIHNFGGDNYKRPVEVVLHYRTPTTPTTYTLEAYYDNSDTPETLGTINTTGETGFVNHRVWIDKGIIKTMQLKLSGSGEINLLGYSIVFHQYRRFGR